MLDSALTRRWRSLASSHIRKRGYRLQVPNFVSLSISMSTFSSPLLTTVVSVDASVRFAAQVEQSDTEARGARSQICLYIPKSLSWIITCPESFCCCSIAQSLDCHLLLDELFASLLKFQQECSWVLFLHPSSHPQGLNMILQLARFVKFNESQWPNTTRVPRSEGLEPYPRKRDRPVGLVATQASRDIMHKCLHHRHNRARDTRYSRQRSHYRLLRQVLGLARIVACNGFEMRLSLTILFDSDVVEQGANRSAVTRWYDDFRTLPQFRRLTPFSLPIFVLRSAKIGRLRQKFSTPRNLFVSHIVFPWLSLINLHIKAFAL